MRRRSRAGGEPLKAQTGKTATPKCRTAPKNVRRRSSSAAGLNNKIALLVRERGELLERQTAKSEVLKRQKLPGESTVLQKTHQEPDKSNTRLSMSVETKRESVVHHQMKSQCLLRRNEYHTTAWINSETTELGLLVEMPELGGVWEIVEIYPYRLTDKQLKDTQDLDGNFQSA